MIAFLISDLNVCGGTHKQFLKLIEYTEKQGVEFVIITRVLNFKQTYKEFKNYSEKIQVIPSKPFWLKVLGRLRIVNRYKWERKFLKDMTRDADIINVHDGDFEYNFDVFSGKKLFWQINDLPRYCRVGVSKNEKSTHYSNKQLLRLQENMKYVTGITVNVTKNAERIRTLFNREADVLYCGISPVSINKDLSLSQKRFKDKKINLLSSGVFFPYRNYETQIKVARKLLDDGWDVQLNIFGKIIDKHYAKKIRNMILQYRLDKNIHVLGQISDSEYRELHQNSDMFLFVNIDQSWGLAVFEAQSCGMPVLVSKSVGAVEILNDGVDAIIVEPTDVKEIVNKIEYLAENEDEYRAICSTSLEFHKKWTWEKAYCSKMLGIISKNIS